MSSGSKEMRDAASKALQRSESSLKFDRVFSEPSSLVFSDAVNYNDLHRLERSLAKKRKAQAASSRPAKSSCPAKKT